MITVFIHGQTANTGTRITLFSAHCITQQSKIWSECHSVTAWNCPLQKCYTVVNVHFGLQTDRFSIEQC